MKRLGHIHSDHFPIFIHLNHKTARKHQQEEPAPEIEDVAEAEENERSYSE